MHFFKTDVEVSHKIKTEKRDSGNILFFVLLIIKKNIHNLKYTIHNFLKKRKGKLMTFFSPKKMKIPKMFYCNAFN